MNPHERIALDRGRKCLDQGDTDAALLHLNQLLLSRPGFADAHYWVGLAHERRGELADAAESLERALRINPGYAEARLALACVHEQNGEWERARELGQTARADAEAGQGGIDATTLGKLANLQAGLGDAYREVGAYGDAVDAYRKALDLRPGFHDIRQRLAVTLREAGLPRQAIAEFQRVLRADPDQSSATVQLGVTLWSVGRREEAMDTWREALEQDPGREDARMYLRLGSGQSPKCDRKT